MDNLSLLNEYVEWKRDRELYPPTSYPEDFMEWKSKESAYIALTKIRDLISKDSLYSESIFDAIINIAMEEI